MKKAFVTFIQTEDYLPGVLTLNQSLRFFGNEEELVILTTRSLSAKAIATLESAGCRIRFVEPLRNPQLKHTGQFNHYTKLRIFELIEFERIIFLDADLLVCADIGSLFFLPNMSAVVAGGLIPENGWTDLNGGFMVVEPSLELFDRMNAAIDHLPSKDGTDQGFLQSFLPDWPQSPELHLDHAFNVPVPYLDIYCDRFGFEFSYSSQALTTNIAVLHYWGPAKPWQIAAEADFLRQMPKFSEAVALWWDLYAAAQMQITDPLV